MENAQGQLLAEAQLLVDEATALGMTVGFAESCTAGICSAAVGSISGASAIMAGSVVSYQLHVKERILGVDKGVLYDPNIGPVSEECAAQMAEGALRVLSCDVAVSVTGIAGPLGAEPGKPVGTVWFARAIDGETYAVKCHFEGDRDDVRVQAASFAIRLVREGLMKA